MRTHQALNMLIHAFGLVHAESLDTGDVIYNFGGEQPFNAMAFPDNVLRLHVPLSIKISEDASLTRLLEANCLGVETGTGQISLNPDGVGLAMVDFIALDGLGIDQIQLRIIDLLLYADYWDSEGHALLSGNTESFAFDSKDMTTIRV